MQAGVGLLVTDVMPIQMIMHNLIITHFSINCSTVICSPTIILMLSCEKPLVKPMAPGSIFYHISFRSTFICIFTFPIYIIKYKKIFILSYNIYQISLSQVAMKGLTTPLLRWLRVLCLFVQVRGTFEEPPTGLIPWFSKTEGNTYATLLHHPFLFQENQRKLKTQ